MRKFSYRWWRFRAAELTAALVVACCILYARDNQLARSRANTPPNAWFVVNRIDVPDFDSGANPIMTYDRQIRSPFRGYWVVEVSRRELTSGLFVLECSGNGLNDYDPGDYIPNNLVRWNWFTGDRCKDLPAGDYQVRATWSMRKDGWPNKSTSTYSNVFKIRATNPVPF